jgi:23S rRNA pseudouridine1911/1915/1917 synthase
MEKREYLVPDSLDGVRLDRAAAALDPSLSRARLKRAIDEGAVKVNGRRRPKGAVVATGDTIVIDIGEVPNVDAPAVPEPDAPLDVVFEGEGVVVVNKPAGMPTAPLRPGETGTLANALVGHYPEIAGIGYSPRDPGLMHRLDNDTSGLVVAARSKEAFETLKGALDAGGINKSYLLVCGSGLADRGTIEFPITNHPKDQRRVYACVHPRDVMRYAPRPASTQYSVVKRSGGLALVEAKVARALRHQIRVHFAALGFPLSGDTLYGGEPVPGLERHALHASRIAFTGGPGVAKFDVTCDLPADMAAIVAAATP